MKMISKVVKLPMLLVLTIAVVALTAATENGLLTVRGDPQASEIVLDVGPLSLPARADHNAVQQPRAQAVALPVDGYLHGFIAEMVDAEDRPVPAVLLHHVNIIAPERRELFSQIMQRIGAAGSETGPIKLPFFLGYPVQRGDSILITAMFQNPTDQSYEGIRLRVRMRYSGSRAWYPRISIQPFYLDVMPPAGIHAYTLPAGHSTKSWEGKPWIGGRVLGVGGHMHKYAELLRLEDVTAGRVLWETKPIVDDDGNPIGMPRKFFFWRLGLSMESDHTYRLTVFYNNPTGQAIESGAMGALGGIIVPTGSQPWPKINRTDPEYLRDLQATYESTHGGHHH